jgi:hypothetical protein
MVTFYDPKYTSLVNNTKLPASKHRLVDLSEGDIATWRKELDQSLVSWATEQSSGVDWSAIVQAAVNRCKLTLTEIVH